MILPIYAEVNITGPKFLTQTIRSYDLHQNSFSVDYKYDKDNWFDTMKNLTDLDHNLYFDEYGKYLHIHELAATFT